MPRVSNRAAGRSPIWIGLRTRLLGALVLTAIVTLATAALTLLAPLQSQLRHNSVNLNKAVMEGARTQFGYLPVRASDGVPVLDKLRTAADLLAHDNSATVIVWLAGGHRPLYDTEHEEHPRSPPNIVLRAFRSPGIGPTPQVRPHGDMLTIAIRGRAQSYPGHRHGHHFVLELIKKLDYISVAGSVVRTSVVDAALVGLAVAILLGIAFSSRLLRRLRLLRDATRSLDERDLTTLVVPEETVSDEIGELAQAFSALHARLRMQEDARRAFVATASHELRTPLASLEGMLELLAEDLAFDPVDIPDARERVALAQVQSRRLASLASDLLDLSRIDAQLELRSEPVELAETARAVTAEFDLRARAREVAVVIDQIGDRSWAQADPGSVARIVRILLDNALAVAPTNSTIEVRIGNGSGPLMIEVADEGPGVPLAERDLIFERFKRGSERRSESGFGLGLAIGSELADRMGGSLELTTATPGATFRLTLPEAGG